MLLSAFVAIVLIGPIGLATMHRVLSRLGRITQAMTRLARHDTTTVIPSRDDRDEVGAMARAVEVFKDNAIQLIAREVELKQLNRRVDIALNNMTHGLCMFDAEQKLIVCNKTYVQMYALTPELSKPGILLQAIENYRATVGNGAIANPEQMAAATAIHAREASAFTQELMDGRIVAVSQRPMQDGGWVAVHEDITERRRAEAKIAHLARHDMLTNLPNRVLFREHLENAFDRIQPGRGFAVHCLDLDHFKTVNDTLGHPIGDELLKLVAVRLIEAVPKTDFIARIGGDEFAVVQTNVSRPEQCSQLASRIVELVSRPYDIDGRHIVIGASIGIAIAPSDGANPDLLLKNADMALYLAKGDGRGTHRFFEREMDKRLQSRRALELDLRKAIANGEFEVYYQPILYLQTGKVSGFEALVRWNHPERGMIPPLDFIPLAEETGLILPLGEWVLRTACAHAAKWPQAIGGRGQSVRHAVQGPQSRAADAERAGGVGPAGEPARARDHRVRAAAGRDPRARRCCISSARSACGFRWTISAPAIRRSPICGTSRSTRSRSTAPSSATCWCARTARPSSAPWSGWRAASASPPSSRASRPRSNSPAPRPTAATRGRAICSPSRCRSPRSPNSSPNATASPPRRSSPLLASIDC